MIDLSGYKKLLESLPLLLQGSNRGYDPVQLFIQFMCSLWCGANRYAHLDIQRFGTSFQRLFGWERIPEHKAFQRYFNKFDIPTTNLVFGAQYRWFFNDLHFYNFTMDNEYSQWDNKPNNEYFNELFRVSKNQIIWGGNYFGQLWTRCEYNKGFIIWDKNQPETLNNFSMAEMAWSSLDRPSKIFHFSVRKNRNKIHPTQKPVELYEWLLKMYAKPTDKILDTHLGSGAIAIACYNAGISLTA